MEKISNPVVPIRGFVVFLGGFFLFMFGSFLFKSFNVHIIFLQIACYCFLLLPALLAGNIPPVVELKEAFFLKKPKATDLFITAVLALSLIPLLLLVSSLTVRLIPGYQLHLKKLKALLKVGQFNVFLSLFFIGILPAFFEELFFRGFILSEFIRSRWKLPVASFVTAVLFTILHLDIYRAVPLLLLGFMMGMVVGMTRSIWVGMVYHFVNNASGVLLYHFAGAAKKADTLPGLPHILFAAAGLIPAVTAFMYLYRRYKQPI